MRSRVEKTTVQGRGEIMLCWEHELFGEEFVDVLARANVAHYLVAVGLSQ